MSISAATPICPFNLAICAGVPRTPSHSACFDQSDKSYSLARKLLKETLLGVAAVCRRDTGWQSPAPIDRVETHAGMTGYAAQRTRYEADYVGEDDYFPFSFKAAQ